MAEAVIDESRALESTTVGIYRTATVVKGGRRFSFSAMVVMGDRQGTVGLGYGKGRGVPVALEKAEKSARKSLVKITLKDGTLPHPVIGKFGASSIKLVPASPGTGVIAGGTARAVLEMVGVRDCLTKSHGSTNQKNLCRATFEGLRRLCSKETIAELRGVDLGTSVVEEILATGQRYEPESSGTQAKAKGPVNLVGKQKTGARGGRGGRRGGGRGRGGPAAEPAPEQQAQPQTEPAAPAEPPAPESTPPAEPSA